VNSSNQLSKNSQLTPQRAAPELDHLCCVGPLNLNRLTKQADTVFHQELYLDEKEFEALDMLATREGETLAFEQLYEAIWETKDRSGDQEAKDISNDRALHDVLDGKASKEILDIRATKDSAVDWAKKDGLGSREAARVILDNLIRQVNAIGEGFMWIEKKPETGYIFRTQWGRVWQMRKNKTSCFINNIDCIM